MIRILSVAVPGLAVLTLAMLAVAALGLLGGIVPAAAAREETFVPVTQEMLENPSPNDWLMFNRTYDAQRFSPLDQINKQNVDQLRLVWSRGMPSGTQETIPIVYRGVLYTIVPAGGVLAVDATTGDEIWEYYRQLPRDLGEFAGAATIARAKNLGIFEDMIYYTAPDGFLVALDARTGTVRWETAAHDYKKGAQHSAGVVVTEGKVISARACRLERSFGSSTTLRHRASREEIPGAACRWRSAKPRRGGCRGLTIRKNACSIGESPTRSRTRG
jgi:alcohol dehydrogenase (cytochrome c)